LPNKKMLICFLSLACMFVIVSCKSTENKTEPTEIHLITPSPNEGAPSSLIMDTIYTASASCFNLENPQAKQVDHRMRIDGVSKKEYSFVKL
jgi:hypothetical protein